MNHETSSVETQEVKPRLPDGDLRASFFNSLEIERGGEFFVKVTANGASNTQLTGACQIALTAQTQEDLLPKIYPLLCKLEPLGNVDLVILPNRAKRSEERRGRDELGLRIRTALRLPACRSWVDPLHSIRYMKPPPSAVIVRLLEKTVELFWRFWPGFTSENAAALRMLQKFWTGQFKQRGRYITTGEVGLVTMGSSSKELGLPVVSPQTGLATREMALYEWSDFGYR